MPPGVPQVFLIGGSDEARVHQERTRLLSTLLPREYRDENLTEIEAASGRQVRLRAVAAEVMSELATASFFPEAPRVIIVEQLDELLGSPDRGEKSGRKKKGATAAPEADMTAAFCRFLERDLPQSKNALILVAIEEPDKYRKLRTDSPLYSVIQAVGRVIYFKQTAVIFQFVDAFTVKDLNLSLKLLSEILQTEDGAGSVLRMLTRQIRFLIQAKILGKVDPGQSEAKEMAKKYFPSEKGLNLLLEQDFAIRKIRQASGRWTINDLNALLPKLERLGRIVYPSSADTYVPDVDTELELFVIEACRGGATSNKLL
jgi:hypothetical protein